MPRRRRKRRPSRLERAGHAAWSLVVSGLSQLARPRVAIAVLIAGLAGIGWHMVAPGGPASVTVHNDVEALARVIRSEAGISSRLERVHVAWATRNLARSRGQSIARMACSPCGEQGAGRPVSSAQPPLAVDRRLAMAVLASPAIADPTGGATHFINPRLQDQLARRRVPGYRNRPYHHVKRIWQRRYGWKVYYRLSPTLEMWGK